MILVAGLAVVGLVGIAAAFYLSMRPGGSRVRAVSGATPGRAGATPGRAGASRPPAGRSSSSQMGSARSGGGRVADRRVADHTASSAVIDFTRPQSAGEDPEPLVTTRRARHGDRLDDTSAEPTRRAAARHSREAEPEEAATTPRSRRRVGFRKGSDVDEEMWPVEAFGGVSDEQFWDDLAADKPLAATARTAQADTAAKRRPPDRGPLPDLRPAGDRGRGDSGGGRSGGRGHEGAGTHPQSRPGPDDRTAIQPAARPSPVTTQPVRASHQPAEPRGRSRTSISADEDPLTSPAYSLRSRGSVDGRSYRSSNRSGDLNREQYESAARSDRYRSDPLRSGGAYGSTVPHVDDPYQQAHGEPVSTPAYDQRYGYGNYGGQASPVGDPRRASGGGRSPGPLPGANGAGDGSRGSRPAYPPVNGYRGPYDLRGYDRR